MSHLFEPRLVNDAFGDPGLYVDFRDERRAILFDIGDIRTLPPRKLMRLSHVFVTHTHMDHFAGFDDLLRVVLGRKERIVCYGGPGFVDQVEHKFRAYTWNVVHRYDVEMVVEAREIDAKGRGKSASFSSRRRFEREEGPPFAMQGDVLHEEAAFRVRARFVDHEMPCLSYAIEERAHVRLAKDRIEAMGVTPGPWLRALKQAVLSGAPDSATLEVRWRDREGEHVEIRTVGELKPAILDVVAGRRVGYVTDLRYNDSNLAALAALLDGVDLLFIESVFLDADREQAARKNHLTARQAGSIARLVRAKSLVPFHFSPRYEGRAAELEAEAFAAWNGDRPLFRSVHPRGEDPHHRLVELRDVGGLAAGDELAVDDHRLVAPLRAGVAQVGLQARPARHVPALRDARVDERPRPVADRGDGLALARDVADEADRLVAQAQLVGIRDAAGKHERVEVAGARVLHVELDREAVGGRKVVESLDLLAFRLRREERHLRAVLLEELARLRVLHLLHAVGHQDRDALALQLRTFPRAHARLLSYESGWDPARETEFSGFGRLNPGIPRPG